MTGSKRKRGEEDRERGRSTRLIFHKFEKHTRGSRCVNLNFSVATRRGVRQGVAEKRGWRMFLECGRGIVVWKCHWAYGAEFRETLFVSPGASVFFLFPLEANSQRQRRPETPSFRGTSLPFFSLKRGDRTSASVTWWRALNGTLSVITSRDRLSSKRRSETNANGAKRHA